MLTTLILTHLWLNGKLWFVSTVLTLTAWVHKCSFSIHQPIGINFSTTNTKIHERHVKSIIYSKVPGIAHRRLMAFYQGSLEGCSPPPPTALLPLTQGRFSSRAHFPKCTCFKSKMSDISETNNSSFGSFIFTASHLQVRGSCSNKRLLSGVLIDIVDTVAFCVLTIQLLKCHSCIN